MANIRIDTFKGTIPRVDKKKLPEGAAQTAENIKLWGRTIEPYGSPVSSVTPDNGTSLKSFYRYDDSGSSYWFEWTTPVSIRQTPLAQDTRNTLYWTDGTKPKKTSNTLATSAPPYPTAYRYMGVKVPTIAPTATGSTGSEESRVYVYTFVTDWGEEGAASAVLSYDCALTDTVTVSISTEPTPDTLYGITNWRLYKGYTGLTGETILQLIADQSFATKTFADDPATVVGGDIIESTDFDEPPDDMEGLVALPNGIFVGFSGREVCFSEPYRPHAWPIPYRKAVHADIVGLGIIGNSVVVATKENPYIFSGIHPETLVQGEVDARQPCVAARGIVSTPFGVIYPTPDGLFLIQPGQGRLVTKELLTTKEWDLFNPETIIAEVYDGRYYASYVIDTSAESTGERKGFIFDPGEADSLLTTFDLDVTAMHQVIPEDKLYILVGALIYIWDASATRDLIYTYKSRTISSPKPINFSAGQIRGDYSNVLTGSALTTYLAAQAVGVDANTELLTTDPPSYGAFGGAELGAIALGNDGWMDTLDDPDSGITFNLYAGGVLRATKVVVDEKPFRLPTGYLENDFELEVQGKSTIHSITVATSRSELE